MVVRACADLMQGFDRSFELAFGQENVWIALETESRVGIEWREEFDAPLHRHTLQADVSKYGADGAKLFPDLAVSAQVCLLHSRKENDQVSWDRTREFLCGLETGGQQQRASS